ncbi:hypothetical protein DFH07DRAFT_904390 [Mycena maculata]|uniref:Uncharacterized protein n=1 Tax=Mycena maculata TaxID=230809 RepID=A0AAD7IUS3_9AGAR|nr:hypothetical protein DFH07DRAFT_904390 [Mycena maculata]
MLLLDNAAKESRLKKDRDAKKVKVCAAKERKKLGVLGRRQCTTRGMGLWGFNESQTNRKFALFLPLHHLWLGYMSELLNLPQPGRGPRALSGATIHPKLLKADFHRVYQSKSTAILGISGLHETEGTFKVVTKENKFKGTQNSIFTFAVPVHSTLPATHHANSPLPIPGSEANEGLETVLDGPHALLQLHGHQFCFRAADRAGRKFKAKESIEL